jgi:HD-GYP domain-containing protein (c-di-GMP phosphodiesterase class II)
VSAIVVNSFDMVLSSSRAMDLLHPAVSEHHLRVAYVSACIAEEIGLAESEVQSILVAGAMHDIVAACAPHPRALLDRALERDPVENIESKVHDHGLECYRMLSGFKPFERAATSIRFHHADWKFGAGEYFEGCRVPFESHILRLADRVAVLPPAGSPALVHAEEIRTAIRSRVGYHFHPDAVTAFEQVAVKESFWLDLTSKHKETLLKERFGGGAFPLNAESLHTLAEVFAKIVDYRSSYTAVHSSGVAKASELLAHRAGLPHSRVRLVGVAGYLHDLGKLAICPTLLEKPGKLTQEEMLLIRQHPYYTRQILSTVTGLEDVTNWAALHHERLDGKGYPFRATHIPLEARIVAVADVFTAITEDRPYRVGMKKSECMDVLHKLVREGAIDGEIVDLLHAAYEDLQHDCLELKRLA